MEKNMSLAQGVDQKVPFYSLTTILYSFTWSYDRVGSLFTCTLQEQMLNCSILEYQTNIKIFQEISEYWICLRNINIVIDIFISTWKYRYRYQYGNHLYCTPLLCYVSRFLGDRLKTKKLQLPAVHCSYLRIKINYVVI